MLVGAEVHETRQNVRFSINKRLLEYTSKTTYQRDTQIPSIFVGVEVSETRDKRPIHTKRDVYTKRP